MSNKEFPFKKISAVLLMTSFLSPVIATGIMVIDADTETQQYAGLQIFLMAIYNTPSVVISLLFYFLGNRSLRKNNNTANTLLMLSGIISIVGIIFMISWGIGVVK